MVSAPRARLQRLVVPEVAVRDLQLEQLEEEQPG
jgi:hypothetical protein